LTSSVPAAVTPALCPVIEGPSWAFACLLAPIHAPWLTNDLVCMHPHCTITSWRADARSTILNNLFTWIIHSRALGHWPPLVTRTNSPHTPLSGNAQYTLLTLLQTVSVLYGKAHTTTHRAHTANHLPHTATHTLMCCTEGTQCTALLFQRGESPLKQPRYLRTIKMKSLLSFAGSPIHIHIVILWAVFIWPVFPSTYAAVRR
jgi:hypothetical protein